MRDDLLEYRSMLHEIESNVIRRVDVAVWDRCTVVAAIALSVVGLSMSQAGDASGWETWVNSSGAQAESTGVLAAIAVHATAVFCVVCSVVALINRSFHVVVLSAMGCALTALSSLLALWERQAQPAAANLSGVGFGPVMISTCAIILCTVWSRTALRRVQTHALPNI